MREPHDSTLQPDPLEQGTVHRGMVTQQPGAQMATTIREVHILVIDDEPGILHLFKRMLGKIHKVTTASDGHDGLARLLSGDYDLAFCDILLPGLSGMEIYEALLAKKPEQAARMIFMTGDAFSRTVSEFLARTGTASLEKPFELAKLQSIVDDAAARSDRAGSLEPSSGEVAKEKASR